MSGESCSGDCDCGGLGRRDFLKAAGMGAAALSALDPRRAIGGPLGRLPESAGHLVPADKRLSDAWRRSLLEKGGSRVYRGAELNLIGMPVGGIAAGQLYICGDGTLGSWKIFNQTYFSGTGGDNYRPHMPEKPVEQGFAVAVQDGGQTRTWTLDRQGFPEVEFVGEYPIARVRYGHTECPVRVTLEAFSPFVPLNARDSALPATVLAFTVENVTGRSVRVALLGWLENVIGFHTTREHQVQLLHRTRTVNQKNRTVLLHSAAPLPEETASRPDVLLADFEGESYGDWTVEGEAFGTKPAGGTLPNQQVVSGFEGEGLVNTFRGGDAPHGRLVSPRFEIVRRYICCLIGGGNHPRETCINLLVGGNVVRTATGQNRERLEWRNWDVREFAGREALIEIVDRASGAWGHVNIDQIVLSDRRRFGPSGELEKLEDFGTMALMLASPGADAGETKRLLASVPRDARLDAGAELAFATADKRTPSLATPLVELPPGQTRGFEFVLSWHFPNRSSGNMYANWFGDAAEVGHYVFDHYDRLARDTRLWHDTYYDSTLPHWLLDRLHIPVCNLATGTCLWWQSGRFWAWEGVGCCSGTCTHVWNYAHGAARLFPELERSAREMQDLDAALHADGLVGFRGQRNNWYAADGQAGTVLKCYREHLMSADDSFLRRNWADIRRVLMYSIEQDGNEDGLIENSQHNTFDINFEGANTFVGSLYLAALRAGEEMARLVGDTEFAARVRRVYESGRRLTVDRLWNGDYFVQDVDLEKHAKHQYGEGCLSDQLFGQGWAHQVGLGYIYPEDKVRRALEAVWRYNWAPDVGPYNQQHKPERWFAYPGDAGLFTCTWPRSLYLRQGVRYRNEVWTGIEYQVAGHMIWEGMVEEGLAIVRGIHDRYDPRVHNPFNEVECGDHYARALASWGVYLALSGYAYDGPAGRLAFAPRVQADEFRAAFTAAEGWGTFAQRREVGRQSARVELKYGRLRLRELTLALPGSVDGSSTTARLDGQPIRATATADDRALALRFEPAVELAAGQVLEVTTGS